MTEHGVKVVILARLAVEANPNCECRRNEGKRAEGKDWTVDDAKGQDEG